MAVLDVFGTKWRVDGWKDKKLPKGEFLKNARTAVIGLMNVQERVDAGDEIPLPDGYKLHCTHGTPACNWPEILSRKAS